MENKVIIAADSTCDLSPELIEKYNIEIIPLPVNLGDKPCLDGVDVTVDDVLITLIQQANSLLHQLLP